MLEGLALQPHNLEGGQLFDADLGQSFGATVLAAPAVVGHLITPIDRIASAIDVPWPVITSTCRSFAMISSGL